jgi:hypothetical protein
MQRASPKTGYFASEAYARARTDARAATRDTVDARLLHAAVETFETYAAP